MPELVEQEMVADEAVEKLLAPYGVQEGRVLSIPVSKVDPNPAQPRRAFSPTALEELVSSIRRHGILQPLVVRPSAREGRYELVAGERRLRAARAAGLGAVPGILAHVPDDRLLEVALVENLQRSSLNPIEEAEAFRSLIDRYRYTQESVAQRVGKSRSAVANALRLLALPDGVRREVEEQRLSAGHARALAGLADAEQQLVLCEVVQKRGLSVRQTEAEVQRVKRGRNPRPRQASKRPPYMRQVEEQLQRVLGTRVRLVQTQREHGRIVIDFHSDAEFERLLEFFS